VRLIDAHGHVNADRFDGDADSVIEGAREAGVERLLVPGWNVASSERALALVERHDWLDAAVGIHPHDAAKVEAPGWQRIVELAAHPRVVAIGETGLDYDRVFSPIEDQLANLRRNLQLARATGKPAILHCRSTAGRRDAQDALIGEVRAVLDGPEARAAFGGRPPAILHSFSGPVDFAVAMLEMGLAISFSGLVFRKGEEPSTEVAPIVPRDRLLVETDSPFLSPPGAPRSRNEPRWVAITAAWLAERRGEAAESLGDALVEAYDLIFAGAATR
jgi:TatD DNase family protein